jgi:hypothetical protein
VPDETAVRRQIPPAIAFAASAMHVIEEHRTPDGLLRFLVTRGDDGDIALGFDGYPWHTHGDILASLLGVPIDAAVRQYVDALLTGRRLIAIARVDGAIRDVAVADSPEPDKYKPANETIEFRYWGARRPAAEITS